MTEEKVRKGKELLDKINKLTAEKSAWKMATSFDKVVLKYSNILSTTKPVSCNFIEVDDIRDIVIERISRKLEKYQKEFNEL